MGDGMGVGGTGVGVDGVPPLLQMWKSLAQQGPVYQSSEAKLTTTDCLPCAMGMKYEDACS